MGTHLEVINKKNNKSTCVVILDRGPAKRLNRIIDLSKQSFEEIAPLSDGIIDVVIKVKKYEAKK